jgi:hypothetical protein
MADTTTITFSEREILVLLFALATAANAARKDPVTDEATKKLEIAEVHALRQKLRDAKRA